MKLIANLIIPFITLFVLIYGLCKKVNVYDSFISGVREGINVCVSIFPTIMGMIIAINLFTGSNFIYFLMDKFSFLFDFFHFPSEIIPIALLRPVSSSASLVVMNNLLRVHGPDSYIGVLASIIQGSTDTTIYIISMYFSSIGIKKIKYSLFVGLVADFFCVVIAIIVVNLYFG